MCEYIITGGTLKRNHHHNCALTLFGGFAPNSKSAEMLSKNLGIRTVSTGSVSKGHNYPSHSLQMMERPLITPDELKALPFGSFVVTKTGVHPMQVRLELFFKWGIKLRTDYEMPKKEAAKIQYANRSELLAAIEKQHPNGNQAGNFSPQIRTDGSEKR